MARIETKPERTSFPAAPRVEQRNPTFAEKGSSAPARQTPPRPAVSEADVRLRAYELYLRRGAAPGDDLADWLQAERELKLV